MRGAHRECDSAKHSLDPFGKALESGYATWSVDQVSVANVVLWAPASTCHSGVEDIEGESGFIDPPQSHPDSSIVRTIHIYSLQN